MVLEKRRSRFLDSADRPWLGTSNPRSMGAEVCLLQALFVAAGVLVTFIINALGPGRFRLRMVKLRHRLITGAYRPLAV
jgi:hypothetical protein